MASQKSRKRYQNNQVASSNSIIAKVPKIFVFTILSGLLLLLGSSFIALNAPSPLKLVTPLATISLYCSACVGGIISARCFDAPKSYLCSLISSALLTALLLTMKLFIPRSDSAPTDLLSLAFHSLIIVSSLLGVFISDKLPKKNKKRKNRSRS